MKVIQLHKNEMQLIEKATQNNREAQRILYDLHAPKMLSVCRCYISDVQHAEEVMLNGFFKVFTKLKGFKQEGSFEGWIRRIMVRESISFLRQKKQKEFLTDEVEVYDTVTNNIKTEMEVEEIQRLIDNLPDGYRLVFVMYCIEGYKHNEIAELLSISEGTSKSQLFKSRKLLQQRLNALNKTSNGTN
ncbi:MAG: RNA polymerase sigma factor [Flavobacteriaceae bacterium]|nr:RNA polymerase sigma factor [Flavobacteriaceae bacterium]